MIAVVDYHKGNLKSVERGLIAAGGDACITDDAGVIARAAAIVLPGVGAFADAARTMEELGQMDVICERVDAGVPFLGICLGMHLMFEEGTEGTPDADDETSSHNARGLALLPGVVDLMPRVGWNSIIPDDELAPTSGPNCFASPLLNGIEPGEFFYFTHSYIAPYTPATVACTGHSVAFPSAVQFRDSAFGVQFHPEKSSDAGARVLANFVSLAQGSLPSRA